MTHGTEIERPGGSSRRSGLALGLALTALVAAGTPGRAEAEWHFVPYLAVAFGGETNAIGLDLNGQVAKRHDVYGLSVTWLSDGWIGAEVDISSAPSFFGSGIEAPITASRLTSLNSNVLLVVPRRIVGDSLRPYAVAGVGLVRASADFALDALPIEPQNFRGFTVGGGVTGFLTDRAGVRWDLRYVRATRKEGDLPVAGGTGVPTLRFWRLGMGVVLRY